MGEFEEVTFTYEVTDANGDTDQAEVTITVNGVNDAPVAADDFVFVEFGRYNLFPYLDTLTGRLLMDLVILVGSVFFFGADLFLSFFACSPVATSV